MTRHRSWNDFLAIAPSRRLIFLTPRARNNLYEAAIGSDDILIRGRETSGVPYAVHDRADLLLALPMAAAPRSLNIVVTGAMAPGEALRQTSGFSQIAAAQQ